MADGCVFGWFAGDQSLPSHLTRKQVQQKNTEWCEWTLILTLKDGADVSASLGVGQQSKWNGSPASQNNGNSNVAGPISLTGNMDMPPTLQELDDDATLASFKPCYPTINMNMEDYV